MVGADVLLTVAEVAVAFAGFASVVVLFQHRDPTKWQPQIIVRLRTMVESSLGALFFSLLPFALHHLGATGQQLWAWSSGLMACVMVGFFTVVTKRSIPLIRSSRLSPRFSLIAAGFTVLVLGVQILNSAGFFFHREFGAYLIGVIWSLAFASLMFLRVVVFPSSGSVGPDE